MSAEVEADDGVAGLYRLPPGEFVAARDQLARQLRAAGDREAARRVAALRRALDQRLGGQPARPGGSPRHGRAAGGRRRPGQGPAGRPGRPAGGGSAATSASAQLRAAISRLTQRAETLLARAGHAATDATLARLAATLRPPPRPTRRPGRPWPKGGCRGPGPGRVRSPARGRRPGRGRRRRTGGRPPPAAPVSDSAMAAGPRPARPPSGPLSAPAGGRAGPDGPRAGRGHGRRPAAAARVAGNGRTSSTPPPRTSPSGPRPRPPPPSRPAAGRGGRAGRRGPDRPAPAGPGRRRRRRGAHAAATAALEELQTPPGQA
jgi:hypothetical protein